MWAIVDLTACKAHLSPLSKLWQKSLLNAHNLGMLYDEKLATARITASKNSRVLLQ